MVRNTRVCIHQITIFVFFVVLFACSAYPKNLLRERVVTTELNSSSDLHFSRVGVYKNNGGLLVAGELHKRSHDRGGIPGYIDIEIISPDDSILAATSTRYHRGSSKSRRSQFSVEIPIDIPVGSVVRIKHHESIEMEFDEL